MIQSCFPILSSESTLLESNMNVALDQNLNIVSTYNALDPVEMHDLL